MTFTFACDNAADEQKKANMARAAADETITNAQNLADQKVAEAQAGFMKLREDYRHKTTTNLVELDHKVDGLEAKARQLTGDPRAALDANLKVIRADRHAFEADYLSLDTASASTWDDAKARVDKEWTHLWTLVDRA
jgi:hypothetical protein